jgi:acylphosphatase
MEETRVRARVLVSGLVQGVNFRHYTRERAAARGVSGWVRNLPDGRVEAVFEGEKAAVEAMIEWCRVGPRLARVEKVEVHWEPLSGERGFRVLH